MANEETLEGSDGQTLGEQIAAGIAAGLNKLTPKKVSIGQYMRARRRKVALTREIFQNGKQVPEHTLTDKEIEFLNAITRPGHYIGRRVQVVIRSSGEGVENESVEIRYSNLKIEQRMENAKHWKNFEDLCRQIVLEQGVAQENAARS